jgi:hypothetical protein
MGWLSVEEGGPKLPNHIPCIAGRCPELMVLEGELENKPMYRCVRKAGTRSNKTGEIYTGNCQYHDHPYSALDYVYWHRDPNKKTSQKDRLKTAL